MAVPGAWLPQGAFEATVREMAAPGAFEATVRSTWLPTGGAFKATVHSGPLLGATGALASAPQGVQRSSSKHRCSASLSLVSLHSAALYTVHGYARVHTSGQVTLRHPEEGAQAPSSGIHLGPVGPIQLLGPVGAIHLLGPVGPIHLLGPVGLIHMFFKK